ncbi:MAG TPA: M4 family metallopeptidase [Thermoanaerobaculia bacterium]|nr:M4 family metallopeptidase [Thermoanaerobaculia bacterium]
MRTIPQHVCGVIPPHILARMAERTRDPVGDDARTTIEHMREVATGRARTLIESPPAPSPEPVPPRKRRRVYDAGQQFHLPGKLARSEQQPSTDVEANEAYDGSGATYDFFARIFRRHSIDGRGIRLDSTVHYGTRFENAMWNGRQIVYGDGDGRIFTRFTASLDVIAHELMHGVTQYSASLGYSGETGALNEHLSDAFGIMVRQYTHNETAETSDWLIGSALLGSRVNGIAIRSMAAPGTAYDDALLGRDPQPWHMRDYVHTTADNGGVHINSGILNHAFYLAAKTLGGWTWEVLGRIWYTAVTDRLRPDATFADFTRATVDIAGELFGNGGRIQRVVAEAWSEVGLKVHPVDCTAAHIPIPRPHQRPAVNPASPKWRRSAAQ